MYPALLGYRSDGPAVFLVRPASLASRLMAIRPGCSVFYPRFFFLVLDVNAVLVLVDRGFDLRELFHHGCRGV